MGKYDRLPTARLKDAVADYVQFQKECKTIRTRLRTTSEMRDEEAFNAEKHAKYIGEHGPYSEAGKARVAEAAKRPPISVLATQRKPSGSGE
jgi:hypothetical protein